jgi:hypothetical protein
MISKETLIALMGRHEAELREYRLSGDAEYLLPLINHALDADTGCLAQDFFNALTDNESIAFQSIREEIGLSGNISVVKMIQKTNLSRPVWNSLLQKMEKYNVATIKNQGVKGTNIVIKESIDD